MRNLISYVLFAVLFALGLTCVTSCTTPGAIATTQPILINGVDPSVLVADIQVADTAVVTDLTAMRKAGLISDANWATITTVRHQVQVFITDAQTLAAANDAGGVEADLLEAWPLVDQLIGADLLKKPTTQSTHKPALPAAQLKFYKLVGHK